MFVCLCTEIKSTQPSFPHVQQDQCKYWCCIDWKAICLSSCFGFFSHTSISKQTQTSPPRFLPRIGWTGSEQEVLWLQSSLERQRRSGIVRELDAILFGALARREARGRNPAASAAFYFSSFLLTAEQRNHLRQFCVRFNLHINIGMRENWGIRGLKQHRC